MTLAPHPATAVGTRTTLRKGLVAAAACALLAGPVQAALIDRGGGLIYDTDQNITWMSDWNQPLTSGYAAPGVTADGTMTWDAAQVWANTLVYGGYSGWRLPKADVLCPGSLNCAGSEIGHLFYVDWGVQATSSWSTGSQAANLALFHNVQDWAYWDGDEYTNQFGPIFAWTFTTTSGVQGIIGKPALRNVVAVRDGDVAQVVPEPPGLALAMLALALTWQASRSRNPRFRPASAGDPGALPSVPA